MPHTLAVTLAVAAAISTAGVALAAPAHAAETPRVPTNPAYIAQVVQCAPVGCLIPEARQTFVDFFSRLMQIPEAVLRRGDAATQDWLRDNPAVDSVTRQASSTADPLACAGSVTAAAGGLLVPAAKILKIRGLIRDLGGVVRSVRLLIGAGNAAEKAEVVATAVGALAAELVGIRGIRDFCFN